MKSFRSLLLSAGLSLTLAVAAQAADNEPGFVDIGQLIPSTKGQYVEVNLSPSILKFAAKIAAKQEPEAAKIIANLKRVRVNVVNVDEANRPATLEQMEGVRRKLEAQGWTQVVNVREKGNGDNVNIHVKQVSDDTIEGLVVTVLDKKGEAVFVNIVGSISADQIATVAENFDIQPLKNLHVKINKSEKGKSASDET